MTRESGAGGAPPPPTHSPLMLEVLCPGRPWGWPGLYKPKTANNDDGEWFVNPSQGLGISGNYGGGVPDGTWNPLAFVVNNVPGTFTRYINGTQVQQNTGLTVDRRWAIGPTVLHLADENQAH